LLHVRDSASTYGEEQKAQVEKVLGELDALHKPRIEVLNKIDLLDAQGHEVLLNRLISQPSVRAVTVSAQTGEGADALLAAIDDALHSDPLVNVEFRIPQHEGAVLAAIEAGMVIHARRYEGNLVYLTVTGPSSLVGRFRAFRMREDVLTMQPE
jgi:GTP-binding protein HflX